MIRPQTDRELSSSATFEGLRPGGVSIDLGFGPEPIEITSADLIFGERKVAGSLTGNPATGDATLRFSALSGVSVGNYRDRSSRTGS